MSRCFELARRSTKSIKLNPAVGAVIVHNGRIIGEGYHKISGSHHAEVDALQNVKACDQHLLKESTLYVTLEPCNHTGKTPPCTDAILTAQIPKVIISCLDPNPKMQGKSVEKLTAHGVQIESGIMENEGNKLIYRYRVNASGRPYVILKFAQSKEGYIGRQDQQVALSNRYSKVLVHKWRSQVDGILIGVNTANIDNPSLTTREFPGESPMRIILDPHGRMRKDLQIFTDGHPYLVISKYNEDANPNHLYLEEDKFSVKNILDLLFQQGVYRLLVEGGAHTISQFRDANLWDEARLIQSSISLASGIKAPMIIGHKLKVQKLDSDIVTYIHNRNVNLYNASGHKSLNFI